MKPLLSIVIPCYNEKQRFSEGFKHHYSYLKKQKYSWELIFVNDGSKDNTLDIIKTEIHKKPFIKLISYPKNKGKGYAICEGIKNAKGKYILFSDIDHSVPIHTLEIFFKYFEKGYDAVIGSRRVKGSRIKIHQHPFREFLGQGFTLLVRCLIDWKILDATCGFKAFRNRIAQKIFKKITIYDWAFDAEILFLCKKFKIKIIQAPVSWSDVEGSRVVLKKDMLNSLLGLFKIHFNDFNNKYN